MPLSTSLFSDFNFPASSMPSPANSSISALGWTGASICAAGSNSSSEVSTESADDSLLP